MGRGMIEGKRVLVTIPVTETQKAQFGELVEAAGGSVDFVPAAEVERKDVDGAAVILGNVPANVLHADECLEWLQTSSAGYEQYLTPGRLAPTTLLTNATGAYGQAVSEHMLASLLCLMKNLHRYRDNQRAQEWRDEGPVTTLVGATVLVMGTGDIGTAFAKLVTALGARAWGVRRKASVCPAPFERMVTLDDVHTMLPQVDVVASVLPSTPQTRFLANADFFSAMKRGAYFVNAGRGDLVDARALVEALESGQVAGAALDVTKPEPLPASSPLWQQENVLLTPHVAGFWHLQATLDNVVALCLDNLRRYINDQQLANVVAR